MLASLMFLGAMRFGEAAALTWRDYDPTCEPLGKLVVEKSYSTKKRKVKGTKTENPREMPVHPTLAQILAAWRLSGFEQLTGRSPRPDDPIVPSRRGAYRNVNASLQRFHEDLERIGLRARRQHDARRTFISIARADGAVADTLHFAMHGPDGDIMDAYTTLPWPALCAEVAKVRFSLDSKKSPELPVPGGTDAGTQLVTVVASNCNKSTKLAERTGLEDAEDGTLRCSTRGEGALRLVDGAPGVTEQHGAPSVLVTADPVVAELEGALALRRSGADAKTLRRALRRIEELLDE